MRLGVNIGPETVAELIPAAERLRYDIALAPEGYRSDAVSVLGWAAARSERIQLASGVLQIPARSPVMTAMTVATLNVVSDGRFRLGLGVSNAYVSEAWHGVRYGAPLSRTREYVGLVRAALAAEPLSDGRETHAGTQVNGARPTVRLPLRPLQAQIPVYLAALGPRSLELAGEVADGWIGAFCSPALVRQSLSHVSCGRRRAGHDLSGFEALVSVPAVVTDDADAALPAVSAYVARFVSLGEPDQNVYYARLARLGYERAAEEIVERHRRSDWVGAAAAVPSAFVQETSLIGTRAEIEHRLRAYEAAGVTTLVISPFDATSHQRLGTLRAVAEAARRVRPAPVHQAASSPPPVA